MTTLCLDFGNTRFKAAVYQHAEMIEEVTLPNQNIDTFQYLLETYQPKNIILASVIDISPELLTFFQTQSHFFQVSDTLNLNFNISISKSSTIGADRLALAAAAVEMFPKKNNLIISIGTCITYNFINQYHQFLGGGISPGVNMRFQALHQNTAHLPLVNEDFSIPFIGYDTKTSMQSGVIFGMIAEVEGMIDRYQQKYDSFNVVLTGGYAPYFARQLKYRIFADPNFLFKGLYILSERNKHPND